MRKKGALTWEYLAAVILVLIIVIVLILVLGMIKEGVLEQKDRFFEFIKEFIGI